MRARERAHGEREGEREGAHEGARASSVRLRDGARDVATRLQHDMRSSVHTVIGFTNLLAAESHGPLTPEQRTFTQHVHEAAHDLERLIEIHLELARARDVRAPGEQLHALDQLLPRLERRIRSAGIRCDVECSLDGALELAVDAERFERAWFELAKLAARGQPSCVFRVVGHAHALTLTLSAPDASDPELEAIAAHDRALDNRTALTLHYAEALLGVPISIDAHCTVIRCVCGFEHK